LCQQKVQKDITFISHVIRIAIDSNIMADFDTLKNSSIGVIPIPMLESV